jgi:hypothetical protein
LPYFFVVTISGFVNPIRHQNTSDFVTVSFKNARRLTQRIRECSNNMEIDMTVFQLHDVTRLELFINSRSRDRENFPESNRKNFLVSYEMKSWC